VGDRLLLVCVRDREREREERGKERERKKERERERERWSQAMLPAWISRRFFITTCIHFIVKCPKK
jgi:hypothetical protein